MGNWNSSESRSEQWHLALWLMSMSLPSMGSRSLQELDIGLLPYLEAQGRCVENNSINSKRTAGLRNQKNQPKTCQQLPWRKALALEERVRGEGRGARLLLLLHSL